MGLDVEDNWTSKRVKNTHHYNLVALPAAAASSLPNFLAKYATLLLLANAQAITWLVLSGCVRASSNRSSSNKQTILKMGAAGVRAKHGLHGYAVNHLCDECVYSQRVGPYNKLWSL